MKALRTRSVPALYPPCIRQAENPSLAETAESMWRSRWHLYMQNILTTNSTF
ncbi:hypothetical protein RRG08_045238 [Elysia crispata]|uniref:Uncharacterized protein n=1 Tax=Elysia crispata TaxID=231223 RepID=A0AAE1DQY7_9GAST|nr:hypothetical protein RRG08_045238 [Elysia crispata]